ncbi:MAG: N-acetyl-gamma-glutamyl-phosphate reductase [Armatimonadetes bacterium]|nr:N-acetyl-gamma-glutamyl-phosphate reductase [Armatimonadota bacterium]MDE2206964.1 N-acetyl-gamma-glutamyl-phosphate reductase [Armatimonadota bacterium]
MNSEKRAVGIVGVTGYAGAEAARLVLRHPQLQLVAVQSRSSAAMSLAQSVPSLAGATDLICSGEDAPDAMAGCEVVILAQEGGAAVRTAPELLSAGQKVVDLSADFRLKQPELYADWYGFAHASPHLLEEAAYGLPEMNRAYIAKSRLVANPGCYPTAATLALAPLLEAGYADTTSIVVDAWSGISGAGRASKAHHFAETNENLSPYKVAGTHRHTPEIEQALSIAAGQSIRVSFTPHTAPVTRGILCTCYAQLTEPVTAADLRNVYATRYQHEPFVRVVQNTLPTTAQVRGTNNCVIGVEVDARANRAVIISAIDNMVKGASGQAIQNINLMLGLPETAGLDALPVWP